MKRFAALLDALLFTPSRNGKLRLMQKYFASVPDPERGWSVAALTGVLAFDAAKPSQVRALAVARVDPDLLEWSYDFVGELAETVPLIWPAAAACEATSRTSPRASSSSTGRAGVRSEICSSRGSTPSMRPEGGRS